jgi:hypothetical protein
MNTSIRFPTTKEKVRQEITLLVPKMLGEQPMDKEAAAVRAVCDAFRMADCAEIFGMDDSGYGRNGDFYATANIDTGEFQLYRNVEAL